MGVVCPEQGAGWPRALKRDTVSLMLIKDVMGLPLAICVLAGDTKSAGSGSGSGPSSSAKTPPCMRVSLARSISAGSVSMAGSDSGSDSGAEVGFA